MMKKENTNTTRFNIFVEDPDAAALRAAEMLKDPEAMRARTDMIDRIISLADKHGVNRDAAVRLFAQSFANVARVATFKNYKPREADDAWNIGR